MLDPNIANESLVFDLDEDNEEEAGYVVTEEDDPIPTDLPEAPPGGFYGEVEQA